MAIELQQRLGRWAIAQPRQRVALRFRQLGHELDFRSERRRSGDDRATSAEFRFLTTVFDHHAHPAFPLDNAPDDVAQTNRSAQCARHALWQMIVAATEPVEGVSRRVAAFGELLDINEQR